MSVIYIQNASTRYCYKTVLQRVGLGQLRVEWTDGVECGLGCLWIPRVGGPRGEEP